MNVTIRAATKHDYPTIVSIAQSATADYIQSVQDLESGDKLREPTTIARKLVAVTPDHQIVGVGTYAQSSPKAAPQKYNIWLFVQPYLQGNTIGSVGSSIVVWHNIRWCRSSAIMRIFDVGCRCGVGSCSCGLLHSALGGTARY